MAMPRNVLKANLPTKLCQVCGRPFTWRKKWERGAQRCSSDVTQTKYRSLPPLCRLGASYRLLKAVQEREKAPEST